MRNKEELKQAIEAARKELDAFVEAGKVDEIYEKSRQLDVLIEAYIEMNEK